MTRDSATWERVKFGEVVRRVKETCKDPVATGIERVIGLEHLEPCDLRVRSWSNVADGTTFTTRVCPGQVLFGKRRAYQRKVAVAEFDAICSGDIYVFESANPRRLLPELLPYICQTDAFFEHAVGTSAGSLSPRTNWTSLATYEFVLPPPDEQRRIAEFLGSWNSVLTSQRAVLEESERVLSALIVRTFWPFQGEAWLSGEIAPDRIGEGWNIVRASELSTELITKGATPSSQLHGADTGIPFLKVYNLTFDGSLDFATNPTWISDAGHRELCRSTVLPGDVLMNIVGPPLGKVARVPRGFPPANINQAIVRFRPAEQAIGDWLELYLLSRVAQNWLAKRSKKTSGQQNLTLEMCRDLPVPIPCSVDEALRPLRAMRTTVSALGSRFATTRDTVRTLTNSAMLPEA